MRDPGQPFDEASERWLERALAEITPLSPEQLDVIRRVFSDPMGDPTPEEEVASVKTPDWKSLEMGDSPNPDERAQMRRYALGACVQIERAHRRSSIEKIAAEAGMGHVTWRRIEDGKHVRTNTYSTLDSYFGWPVGTSQRAIISDEAAASLADQVGVTSDSQMTPAGVVESLARTHRYGAVEFGAVQIPVESPPARLSSPRPASPTHPFDAFDVTTLKRLRAWLDTVISELEP